MGSVTTSAVFALLASVALSACGSGGYDSRRTPTRWMVRRLATLTGMPRSQPLLRPRMCRPHHGRWHQHPVAAAGPSSPQSLPAASSRLALRPDPTTIFPNLAGRVFNDKGHQAGDRRRQQGDAFRRRQSRILYASTCDKAQVYPPGPGSCNTNPGVQRGAEHHAHRWQRQRASRQAPTTPTGAAAPSTPKAAA